MSNGIYLSNFAQEFNFFFPWLELQVRQADIFVKEDEEGDFWLSEGQVERLVEHLESLGYDIEQELDKAESL